MPDALPPDTTAYLLLGLALFFGILLVYVASLVLRVRNLRKDEALLAELAGD